MAANFQSDSISFSSSIDFKRPVMKRISWKVQTNLIQTFQLFNRFQLPDIAQLFRRNKKFYLQNTLQLSVGCAA